MKKKLQLILFSETKMREDVYQKRKGIQDRELDKFLKNAGEYFEIDHIDNNEIRTKKQGQLIAEKVNENEYPIILYIPIFINPAIVAHTARSIRRPMALVGNHAKDSLSQLGFLAAAGSMDQIGIEYRRIPWDGCTKEAADSILSWISSLEITPARLNAEKTAKALEGQTFGCIGGRSLGISTGTADAATWEKIWGIDIEHIDQYELVRRSDELLKDKPETVDQFISYIQENYGMVEFDASQRFTPAHLRKMTASYLAAMDIIADYDLDFIGLKCQTELSNGYCLQCLNVQLLNDPYDARGPKCPMVCSCEADADGALSMQILKLISGGKPTALQDIAQISPEYFELANCGAMASYFAALSDDPKANLKQVHLVPHGFGEAGGAATQFICAEGTFTYMRLTHRGSRYRMVFFTGKPLKMDREKFMQRAANPYRPTSFVSHHVDLTKFMEVYGSNHIHVVEGDYTRDLEEFCKLKNIEYYHL